MYRTNGGGGNYWLGIGNPLEDPQTISATSQTVSAFGVIGDSQEWAFEGTAGEAVGWTYQGVRQLKNWKIVGPDDGVISMGDGPTNTHTFAFTPVVSGTHKIIFEDVKPDTLSSIGSVGPFAYTMTPAVVATMDERINGTLAGSRDTNLYAIEGEAGRTITVSAYWGALRDAGDGALDSEGRFRLIGPDGEVLAAPSLLSTGNSYYRYYYSKLYEFELPTDGTYFVEVYRTNGGGGNYWLGIGNPLEDPQTISATSQTVSAFGVIGDSQEWAFEGTAGEAVGWTLSRRSPVEELEDCWTR